MKKSLLLLGLLCPFAALAEAMPFNTVRQSLQQGGYWLGQVPVGSMVTLGGKAVPVMPVEKSSQAYVLLGFDRFEPSVRWLKVCPNATSGAVAATPACYVKKLQIKPRTYATQNVKGVPKAQRDPDATAQTRMAADNQAIGAARRAVSDAVQQHVLAPVGPALGFTAAFTRPSIGRTSGVYGSRRLFDGAERSWHKGIDYAAPTDTPVYAPASGVVRLARDTFISGNLVMLDHGGNLSSLYAHLHTMAVKVGQPVKAGDKLGTVGTTGRSSGPHLHWGLYVGNVAIDPAFWVE